MNYWSRETFDFGGMGDIKFPAMDMLTARQKDNLEALLQMSPTSIMKAVKKLWKDQYKFVTDNDNYLLCIPKQNASNLMLVSHVDVVAGVKFPKNLIWESPLVLHAENSALGADDRAGVFVILEAAAAAEKLPYVLLTNYEETGGRGVKEFCKKEKLPEGVHFMVEFDRQGFGEYVVYSDAFPKELKHMMGALGYEKKNGSYSDVSTLTDTFSIAHINLCVGYFGQHTTSETLIIPELLRTVNTAIILANTEFPTPFKVEKKVAKTYGNYAQGNGKLCAGEGCTTRIWTDYWKNSKGQGICYNCHNKQEKAEKGLKSAYTQCDICHVYTETSGIKVVDDFALCPSCQIVMGVASGEEVVEAEDGSYAVEAKYPKFDSRYDVKIVDGEALNLWTIPKENKIGQYRARCDCCQGSFNAYRLRKITYRGKNVGEKTFVECAECLDK